MDRSFNRVQLRGFSLIELVIVVVIIGIIGAIAIPRLSRGAEGAADSALAGDLAVLRNAIDLYATEHNGDFPDAANIVNQLTQFSDLQGGTSSESSTDHIFGPYIRQIPALKVGDNAGSEGISGDNTDPEVGWLYDPSNGSIIANTGDDADASGKLYSDY